MPGSYFSVPANKKRDYCLHFLNSEAGVSHFPYGGAGRGQLRSTLDASERGETTETADAGVLFTQMGDLISRSDRCSPTLVWSHRAESFRSRERRLWENVAALRCR